MDFGGTCQGLTPDTNEYIIKRLHSLEILGVTTQNSSLYAFASALDLFGAFSIKMSPDLNRI